MGVQVAIDASGSATSAVEAADVLDGFLNAVGAIAATTFLTVPAGRTWVGTVSVNAAVGVAAASAADGQVTATVSVAGAGAAPPAGTVFQVQAKAAANAAGGTVGTQGANSGSTPLTIVAPTGNAVNLQFATGFNGTSMLANVTAVGTLQ